MPFVSAEDVRCWQEFEKKRVSALCEEHNILFITLGDLTNTSWVGGHQNCH